MTQPLKFTALTGLGVVRLRGPDAAKFLQGQLSNDTGRLTDRRTLLAGYHNAQGRTIALLRLIQWDVDDILAVLPRELAAGVHARLSKFVLRAKVRIADESAAWAIHGIVSPSNPAIQRSDEVATEWAARLPVEVGEQRRVGDSVLVRVAGESVRWLAASPAEHSAALLELTAGAIQASEADWQRLDVAAGVPQVYSATSEEFVAQMLNLDVLDAIAFDKGCYTGQEVIARAHYRGRVKRRMQRFITRDAGELHPGESGQLADGRAFKVVSAVQLDDGRCDFLAVAPFGEPAAEVIPNTGATHPAPLAADQVALPYPLPE